MLHDWNYWGGTRGFYKLRSCRQCFKIEKLVDGLWVDTSPHICNRGGANDKITYYRD